MDTTPARIDRPKIVVEGKFFRCGGARFHPKGVCYGPFQGEGGTGRFLSPDQTRRDFELIRALGANVLRIYELPDHWWLDLAAEFGLRVLLDVPWDKHLCFLDSRANRRRAHEQVWAAARACAGHPALFAISVANEVPADIARWSGARRVSRFLDELVATVKSVDIGCLCTFGNYPTTEFLSPQTIDFHCFNVYLHDRRPFEDYLARLQMIAGGKPLIIGETGVDALREGEGRQAEILRWQVESAFRGGAAGVILFGFTDEWVREGQRIEDWQFGLTRADRTPRASYEAARRQFEAAPRFPLVRFPLISVVVASYNGAVTLPACLESLERLDYPACEVILVDDGSTDDTRAIAARFPRIKYLRHEANRGLSAARNTGIHAARGEIVAFTDADCRVDADWLYHLVGAFLERNYAGVGGPNLLPEDDTWVGAAVMAAPGGPAHVMLDDRRAEHLPGCNMAFLRAALLEMGGFDPAFRAAGDDVDICWRLQRRGLELGFSPAAFVWHYRRSSVGAYLKQQAGYGNAEALLLRRHPDQFSGPGNAIWHGRIYAGAGSLAEGFGFGASGIIYHGRHGTAPYQEAVQPGNSGLVALLSSLEYHVLVVLPAAVASWNSTLALAILILALVPPLWIAGVASARARLAPAQRRWYSRPLIAWLTWLQPLIRAWARYRGRLRHTGPPLGLRESLESASVRYGEGGLNQREYWDETGGGRLKFLDAVSSRLSADGWMYRVDSGWDRFDLEIWSDLWTRAHILTAEELHGGGRLLVRCRLRGGCTSSAWLGAAGLLAVPAAAVAGWFEQPKWLWAVPAVLAGVLFAAARLRQRVLLSVLAVRLDEVAKRIGLVRLDGGAPTDS